MTYYTKILPWENKRRLGRLAEFRALVIEYFNNSSAERMGVERIEEPEAEEARVKINRMMDEVHDIILYAGVKPWIRYIPPPAVGGYIQNIDLVQNIFNLHRFQIAPNNLLDFVDRAIGIYENNSGPAFRRAINPFFLSRSRLRFSCSNSFCSYRACWLQSSKGRGVISRPLN